MAEDILFHDSIENLHTVIKAPSKIYDGDDILAVGTVVHVLASHVLERGVWGVLNVTRI